jgi:hypothetical protein
MNKLTIPLLIFVLLNLSCETKTGSNVQAEQWQEVELVFSASETYQNPYTDVEFWVEFTGPNDEKLIRPGFWDQGQTWKVRFASPADAGNWQWTSHASNPADKGLIGKTGRLAAKPYSGNNPLIAHGLLHMSPGKRNVVHADGSPFLMIGDTPWALPWRGTVESVTEYAENRQARGFNTALLMSLQPDREAVGPRNRTEDGGFDVAFEDLKDGHINQLNPEYFQYFDSLRNILIDHGIVPVFQPVFHGFGWKGKKVLGKNMDAAEYARFCRYLLARFGAKPAMWLVGADSDGVNVGVKEGGEEFEKWDAYQQPTGLHYSPFDAEKPAWWNNPEEFVPHLNRVSQDQDWLDFQWCQTGHGGEHQLHKVALMYDNKPTKAVANAEPTYEGIRDSLNGAGWWQGHEAWLQFTSGGTMGVVYGAGGLWNWKLRADEPGWPDWANSKVSWKEAIQLPGAVYVGYLGKALKGLDITDIKKHPELAGGQLCLAKPGKLYIVYLPDGGEVAVENLPSTISVKWFDPQKGEFVVKHTDQVPQGGFQSPVQGPSVLIIQNL